MKPSMTQLTSTGGNDQFYPTPDKLIGKMLSGVDWRMVENVLEPSAGKGNLVKAAIKAKWRNSNGRESFNVDCIEIDPYLQAILKANIQKEWLGEMRSRIEILQRMFSASRSSCENEELRNLRDTISMFDNADVHLVHDNFLTYKGWRKYQLIIMNPPFADGDKHLLKALELQKDGGSIICLLNAETLNNPYTNSRQVLRRELEKYEADITIVEDAFRDAERTADVDVAIVRVSIPERTEFHSNIWERMEKAAESEQHEYHEVTDIVAGDFIEQIVMRFNVEVAASIELIKEYHALRPYILKDLDSDNKYNSAILTLTVGTDSNYLQKIDIDDYLHKVRLKYWRELFRNEKFVGRLTSELRKRYTETVDKMANYDFTLFNIKNIFTEMNMQVVDGVKQAILDCFDKLTSQHSHYPECANTIHYYDGWKTNKAHKLGKKAIIPTWGMFSTWAWRNEAFEVSTAFSVLSDIEKVFDYLNGTMTDEYDIRERLQIACANGQTRNIQLKYFKVDLYKKGTTHIKFDNLELVDRMNIYCGKNKNWLPPNYGRTKYSDMQAEERAVVDDFQGEKDYERIYARADFFLAEPTRSVCLLTGGD